jgi:hypothetical protein
MRRILSGDLLSAVDEAVQLVNQGAENYPGRSDQERHL